MSDYKNYWEESIDIALKQTEAEQGKEEYANNISNILSCFNTLIDLADNTAPLVFAEGIANQYLEEFGEKADEELADKLINFSKTIGPDPDYYDALAVHLFRALYAFSAKTGNSFDDILRLQMTTFVELYKRTNFVYPNKKD